MPHAARSRALLPPGRAGVERAWRRGGRRSGGAGSAIDPVVLDADDGSDGDGEGGGIEGEPMEVDGGVGEPA